MAIGQTVPQKYNALVVAQGTGATLNITAATVVKAVGGRVAKVSVLVAGSAPGAVHNCATTGAVAAGNKVAVIADTVGVYDIDFPCSTGITIVPGTGQTLAVSFA